MKTESVEFLARIAHQATDTARSRPVGDDRIFIRGLRVDALIGVYEYERQQRQPGGATGELGQGGLGGDHHHQSHQRRLRGIGLRMKHAFASKQPADPHAVDATDE